MPRNTRSDTAAEAQHRPSDRSDFGVTSSNHRPDQRRREAQRKDDQRRALPVVGDEQRVRRHEDGETQQRHADPQFTSYESQTADEAERRQRPQEHLQDHARRARLQACTGQHPGVRAELVRRPSPGHARRHASANRTHVHLPAQERCRVSSQPVGSVACSDKYQFADDRNEVSSRPTRRIRSRGSRQRDVPAIPQRTAAALPAPLRGSGRHRCPSAPRRAGVRSTPTAPAHPRRR